jgi:hypothetical protein
MDLVVGLVWFVTPISHLLFYFSLSLYMHYLSFYCTFSCYLPLTNLDLQYIHNCSYTDIGWAVQWLRLALSNGPNRVAVFCLITWGRNRSSFWNVTFFPVQENWTMDKVQNPSNPKWLYLCLQVIGQEDTYTVCPIEIINPKPWTRD